MKQYLAERKIQMKKQTNKRDLISIQFACSGEINKQNQEKNHK